MGDTGIRRSIVHRLSHEYPGLYTAANIALVATHSHAGVGGYLENLLPHITSLGYVRQTADAIVEGTVLAVRRAHASLAPGRLHLGNTTVLGANINRSPSAYLANPEEERARYEFDVDKEMTLLRFDDVEGHARGFLSFFPVHGTSLYQVCFGLAFDVYHKPNLVRQNNTLVSGDNKGMAAYLYEGQEHGLQARYMRRLSRSIAAMIEPDAMPGETKFIAGFTQCRCRPISVCGPF